MRLRLLDGFEVGIAEFPGGIVDHRPTAPFLSERLLIQLDDERLTESLPKFLERRHPIRTQSSIDLGRIIVLFRAVRKQCIAIGDALVEGRIVLVREFVEPNFDIQIAIQRSRN